jgi:hypothetical protein
LWTAKFNLWKSDPYDTRYLERLSQEDPAVVREEARLGNYQLQLEGNFTGATAERRRREFRARREMVSDRRFMAEVKRLVESGSLQLMAPLPQEEAAGNEEAVSESGEEGRGSEKDESGTEWSRNNLGT